MNAEIILGAKSEKNYNPQGGKKKYHGFRRILGYERQGSRTYESGAQKGVVWAEAKKQKIKLKDIMVAGICLTNSCPIATSNKKHFERMGAKIFDAVKNNF